MNSVHSQSTRTARSPAGARGVAPRPSSRPRRTYRRSAWWVSNDRGAVAMEFALVAPFLVAVVLAMLELGRSFEVQQIIDAAAREGARLGAMDRRGLLEANQTSNDKIEQDVRNFLTAAGLPGDEALISITHESDSSANFDFDASGNAYQLFCLQVQMPYASVRIVPAKWLNQEYLSSRVVFRSSRPVTTE